MIDLSELLTDPDFCQTFTVTRDLGGDYVSGVKQTNLTTFEVTGIIVPATTNDIQQVPEADRVTGMIAVYSPVKLNATSAHTSKSGSVADEVPFEGEQYKIIQGSNFMKHGFFKAMAVRKLGA